MIFETQVFGRTTHDESRATFDVALNCLQERFSRENPPTGYLAGRTQMRNAIAEETGCSLLRAERLVEDLEAQGHLRYEGETYERERLPASWTVIDQPLPDRY